MADQSEDTEKPFDPTPQKLKEAREKGDVAKSQDLNATAAYTGLYLALLICVTGPLQNGLSANMSFLDKADMFAVELFSGNAQPHAIEFLTSISFFLGLLFCAPIALVLLSAISQRSVTFSPSKIAPKLNRVSPISNAKQKFGASGLFEFAKSFLKLLTYSLCLATFLSSRLGEITATPNLHATNSTAYLGKLLLDFLGIVVLVSLTIGCIDYAFQYMEHRRKLRMSRKEIQDETKQSEGDPHFKQERQSRGRERALAQSLTDVETADVVITNPTHFAVALHWSREPGAAPVCVAKGVDEVAKNIRGIAIESGVPIHQDPPTARAIYASTNVGEEIPTELYQAVAAAIRYSEEIRNSLRNRAY